MYWSLGNIIVKKSIRGKCEHKVYGKIMLMLEMARNGHGRIMRENMKNREGITGLRVDRTYMMKYRKWLR